MVKEIVKEAALLQIGEQFGLPLYVYDAAKIASQIERLQAAFAGVPLRLKYAMKALSAPGVLDLMRRQGVEIDAVSIEEVKLALEVGFAPQQILFTTSCVPFREIEEAVGLGVLVNLDSLPAVKKFGEKFGAKVKGVTTPTPLCVRINPGVKAGGHAKIQTGHRESKFGVSVEQLSELTQLVSHYGILVRGLHVHTGSDIYQTEAFIESQAILFETALKFPELQFVDFGGGFKVPYRPEEKGVDLSVLGPRLTEAFKSFCGRYGRELEMWFEPGKFLVSEAGTLLVEVTVVKETPALTFVGVNSGLNHLIRPMMYDAYHHIVNLSNPNGVKKRYNVVGYICETDTLGVDLEIAEVREGDTLAILNAGAYGYTMSSNYNSKPRPAEVLVENGEAKLITRRETFADIKRNYL